MPANLSAANWVVQFASGLATTEPAAADKPFADTEVAIVAQADEVGVVEVARE